MRFSPFMLVGLIASTGAPLTAQSAAYLKLVMRAGDSSLLVFLHANVRDAGKLQSGDSVAARIAAAPIYIAASKIKGWRDDLDAAVPVADLAGVHRQLVNAVDSLLDAASAASLHAEHCKAAVLQCDEVLRSAPITISALSAQFAYIRARNRLSRMIGDLGGHLDSLPANFGEKDDPDLKRRP